MHHSGLLEKISIPSTSGLAVSQSINGQRGAPILLKSKIPLYDDLVQAKYPSKTNLNGQEAFIFEVDQSSIQPLYKNDNLNERNTDLMKKIPVIFFDCYGYNMIFFTPKKMLWSDILEGVDIFKQPAIARSASQSFDLDLPPFEYHSSSIDYNDEKKSLLSDEEIMIQVSTYLKKKDFILMLVKKL